MSEVKPAIFRKQEGSASSQLGGEDESNVLLFSSGIGKRVGMEAGELLATYDKLIALLRETDNDGLDLLTDGMLLSAVGYRKAMAHGCDDASMQRMIKDLRAGLHEFPRTLRSLLPGLGPRLSESLEHKLGIQFSTY